ncbi:uncharacterized protein OCT59_014498 [Rhizophagus irregularis]|uniref:uncharacterized protein n=1 Tax=Rhizophagus irregularis TaxID=588596 RepID=UPI00332BA496|nr:hypothetical protein OCT59_014498 [Rhizophagus irregularis]
MREGSLISDFFDENLTADVCHILVEEDVYGYYNYGDITRIPQFIPPIHTINESAPEFKLCIDDILRRIKNMGPVVDSNEAMRCEIKQLWVSAKTYYNVEALVI